MKESIKDKTIKEWDEEIICLLDNNIKTKREFTRTSNLVTEIRKKFVGYMELTAKKEREEIFRKIKNKINLKYDGMNKEIIHLIEEVETKKKELNG